ncbi:hypothetical protein D1614_13590 [Maribellus luteus]|uniref:Polysaccharide pyruvyl transferase domain-containing protein n=1 Tax=Maribellus luteus TaxID=2305463 RepID=A0A399T108_9BACT|nr:polysaccharide pyruvyl transferase family protein [Maribellus luteus]RIJ47613.1 hypothetical protein D1614_13590 [Maribellus luteus]
MKRILYLIGPYDRYNYGDILFPILITKELVTHFDSIEILSTTKSDLTKIGGFKTEDFKGLNRLKSNNKNTLVVAGGESLFVNWGILASYLIKQFRHLNVIFVIIRRIFGYSAKYRLQNFIGRILLGGKTYIPLAVGKHEIKNLNYLVYNSLGGTALNNDLLKKFPKIIRNYNSVDYLAVRDKKTNLVLKKNNIKSLLVPDIAILISKHFNNTFLKSKISNQVKNENITNKSYIFFQISKSIGNDKIDIIADQLRIIHEKTGKEIVLCPIGIALGHDNHLVLTKLSNQLEFNHLIFDENVNIWDIMYLISNSCLYIGTSLHGVITSMSYGIPYVGLEILKVKAYIETWGVKEMSKISNVNNFTNDAIKALELNSYDQLRKSFEMQKQIVEDFLDKTIRTLK